MERARSVSFVSRMRTNLRPLCLLILGASACQGQDVAGQRGAMAVGEPVLGPQLNLTSGQVLGTTSADGEIEAFLGIPYADPPKRFERARLATPWTQPRDATSYGPACYQPPWSGGLFAPFGLRGPEMPISENCLTLNVWRPKGKSNLPILFFMHGGGGIGGTGSALAYSDFPELARNAVVVTIQYRLGGLAYLALRELSALNADNVSGNLQLWDSALALKWVRANAAAFGGSADRITIHGESSGGALTLGLYSSRISLGPEGRPLFSSAIIQSWPFVPGPLLPLRAPPEMDSAEVEGKIFVKYVGCDGWQSKGYMSMLDCIQRLPIEQVFDAFSKIIPTETNPDPPVVANIGPNIDGVAVPLDPAATFVAGGFAHVPLVMGVAKWEAGPIPVFTWSDAVSFIKKEAQSHGLPAGNIEQLVSYYSWPRFPNPTEAFSTFHHDIGYYCYARKLLDIVTNTHGVPAAAYEMDYGPAFYLYGIPTHGSELQLLFGSQNYTPQFSETDWAVSRDLQKRWTSFNDPVSRAMTWQPFGPTRQMNHLGPSPWVSTNLRGEVCALMDGIYFR